MAAKYILLIAVCFFLSYTNALEVQMVNGKVKITVGTASGCSDTVTFIASLNEVYDLYKDFLDIEFIPWGRTRRYENGTWWCQFGVNDCWANRLHRCALSLLQDNLDAQMQYMTCEFTTPYPAFLQGSYICAQSVGLSLIDVDYCVANAEDELDLEAERRGTEMTEALNFVPAIVFNDDIDLVLHTQARFRLKSMVCLALAAEPSTGVTNCSL